MSNNIAQQRKLQRIAVQKIRQQTLYNNITPSAIKILLNKLKQHEEPEDFLSLFIDTLKQQRRSNNTKVDEDIVNSIFELIFSSETNTNNNSNNNTNNILDNDIQVILKNIDSIGFLNAFEFPQLYYDTSKKKFQKYSVSSEFSHLLFGSADDKANMFRERYHLIRQRLERDPVFAPQKTQSVIASANQEHKNLNLSTLESLSGSTGYKCVLGMLSIKHNQVYLEDLTQSMPLDINEAQINRGLFTESSLVLVRGHYANNMFHVSEMGLPPPEERELTLSVLGTNYSQFLPYLDSVDRAGLAHISELAQGGKPAVNDDLFVILSDVHLDSSKTFTKLRDMFQGYAEQPPTLFIFFGDFASKPISHQNTSTRSEYTKSFESLASLISEFPEIHRESRFVFVPGPNDPGNGAVLPRPRIPTVFTRSFQDKVPRSVFMSNPCRIRFYDQELVLFREDLFQKLRRHSILSPENTNYYDMIETIIDNSHLCPLPITSQPIYWNLDHAMRLYPTPRLILLADRCEQFQEEHNGCTCVNPGSFATDFTHIAYIPSENKPQFTRVL